jgi:uncharacterized protein
MEKHEEADDMRPEYDFSNAKRVGRKYIDRLAKGTNFIITGGPMNQHIDIPTDELREVCEQFQVRELSLFGSVLRSDFTADSDVDMLVEFRPEARIGFLELSRLQRNLTELLGRTVDLVPKRGLKPVIRDEILGSARVIYAI